MSAPVNLYPLSAQDGSSIPVDVIRSLGLVEVDFTTTNSSITLAEDPNSKDYSVCVLYATAACLIVPGSTNIPSPLVNGTDYPDMVFVPANIPLTVLLLSGTTKIKGISASGTLYIQRIQKWAAKGLSNQFSKK